MVKRAWYFCLLSLVACVQIHNAAATSLTSPSGDIKIDLLFVNEQAHYRVFYRGAPLINTSKLGFKYRNQSNTALQLREHEYSSADKTWTLPWGEVERVRDHYNQLSVTLSNDDSSRALEIVFRAYDDGLAFHYKWPKVAGQNELLIDDELTEFAFAEDANAWWIPAYQPHRYEYLYQQSPLNTLETVHTPLTLRFSRGVYVAVHEAALTDFASMTLQRTATNTLKSDLVPWPDGTKVKAQTPHQSPWRTIQIAERPGALLESNLILNLNEPNKLGDVDWAKPAKYAGIWWGMHLRQNTWGPGPRHGATTDNAKSMIDFAAQNGLDAVLIEGWNTGWEQPRKEQGPNFIFTQAYPDFDIKRVVDYATNKGVKLIGHHETRSSVQNYERQMDDAFKFYQTLGVNRVKTGYVGRRIDGKHWHHGQYMVNHYRKVLQTAAERKISLNVHEPIKDTGIRRTYPNMMTREGARGQEFNAWSKDGGNPPEHTTILPFTRMLSGPMDFTPGIFDLVFKEARPNNQVNTTLAKQLALYVVLYSPLQMVPDLPENYADNPAFQFIRDVPVDWRKSQVLDGKIGDFAIIARQDRASDDWYVGAITDEHPRSISIELDFLDDGNQYQAQIYADGEQAHWEKNPHSINITSRTLQPGETLTLVLQPGGGQAIRFRKLPDLSKRKVEKN